MKGSSGHYAADTKILASYQPTDIAINCIEDLIDYNLKSLLTPANTADGNATVS